MARTFVQVFQEEMNLVQLGGNCWADLTSTEAKYIGRIAAGPWSSRAGAARGPLANALLSSVRDVHLETTLTVACVVCSKTTLITVDDRHYDSSIQEIGAALLRMQHEIECSVPLHLASALAAYRSEGKNHGD